MSDPQRMVAFRNHLANFIRAYASLESATLEFGPDSDAVNRVVALGQRHNCYPDVDRFDVLDVTEAEIKQLVEVAPKVTSASDLEPVVEIVERLRIDGHIADTAEFEALVLRGEIAPPPPPPDIQCRPGGTRSSARRCTR